MIIVVSSFGIMIIDREDNEDIQKSPPIHISYILHDPIYIHSNAEFASTASSEGWTGDGSKENPYLIYDYIFNVSMFTGSIYIENTDVYFLISNCFLGSGVGYPWHIRFLNVENGRIENNYFETGVDCTGIFLENSHYNRIRFNTFYQQYHGIQAISSTNNIIENNTINMWGHGVWLKNGCNSNVMRNNTIYGGYDFALWDSNNNVIESNFLLFDGSLFGILLKNAENNTISRNDFQGERKFYIFITDGSNANNITENLIENKSSTLDWLDFGWDSTFSDTVVYINQSSGNLVYGNIFKSNTYYGIKLGTLATQNHIWNNIFDSNNGATGSYDPSHIQAYDMGTSNWWNSSGTPHGYGNNWSDWPGPDISPVDGIVDYPYPIDGSAGSKDYYPLAEYEGTPIPEPSIIMLVPILAIIVLFFAWRKRR